MDKIQVGVISDTHGLLRPQAIEALAGSELIIHAGDIGKPEILTELAKIAPVIAIRGNNDRDGWAQSLPERTEVEIGAVRVYLLHNLKELDLDLTQAGYAGVISGHSHQPLVKFENDLLYLNPGSAGPRRFKLPISVARLVVQGHILSAEIIELEI